jgi:hypothetical protein
MAKSTGGAGRTGTVKPNAPPTKAGPVGDWDPKWEATPGGGVPAYLITPDGTILDNRKILASAGYTGAWENSHSDAIRVLAKRNGWKNESYATLGSRGWGAGRKWEGLGRGGFVDVRVPNPNPASGFKRAQNALMSLITIGAVTPQGRFTYAWGLGQGAGWQGEGQWAGTVQEFVNADSWRDLGPG